MSMFLFLSHFEGLGYSVHPACGGRRPWLAARECTCRAHQLRKLTGGISVRTSGGALGGGEGEEAPLLPPLSLLLHVWLGGLLAGWGGPTSRRNLRLCARTALDARLGRPAGRPLAGRRWSAPLAAVAVDAVCGQVAVGTAWRPARWPARWSARGPARRPASCTSWRKAASC